MGVEPDPERIPLSPSDFPIEVQNAIYLFSFLSDNWEGMSGSYLGKDWSLWPYLAKVNEIENEKEVLLFAKILESCTMNIRHKKAQSERERQEKKLGGNKSRNTSTG